MIAIAESYRQTFLLSVFYIALEFGPGRLLTYSATVSKEPWMEDFEAFRRARLVDLRSSELRQQALLMRDERSRHG